MDSSAKKSSDTWRNVTQKDARVEGLRGASALAVLGYHTFGFGALAATEWRFGFSGGGAAVYIFFALSAFLLCRAPVRSWQEYYTHRIFRIFPTWFLVLPLYVFVGLIPFTPQAVVLIQNWFPLAIRGAGNPTWTLSIELGFYAALPAWRWVLDRQPYLLLTACVVVTVASVATGVIGWGVTTNGVGLAFLSYAVGSLAARDKLPAVGAAPATALVLGAFVCATFIYAVAPIVVGISSGLLLMSMPRTLARLQPFGTVAYPVYLLGYPVLMLGQRLFFDPWIAAVFGLVTIPVAFAVTYGAERPMIHVGQALARRGGC